MIVDEAGPRLTALIETTAGIVAAYVGHNPVALSAIAGLITDVHAALRNLDRAPEPAPPPRPAVSIRTSVTPDHIVCLEDGLKLKSLTRHLRTRHRLSPDQYRVKWGLRPDYPMVAPNYSAVRSEMAKAAGLGRKAAGPTKPAGKARQSARARPG